MGTAKDLGGRPSKLTPEAIRKLEEVFALDGSIGEACFYADISLQTYYTWMKDNPRLLERFEELRNKPFLKARQTIIRNLDNPHYAFEYMKRKKRKEFGDGVDITADIKQDVMHKLDGETAAIINRFEDEILRSYVQKKTPDQSQDDAG
jgi:hypothetical protein